MAQRRDHKRQRGAALVIVLWVTVLLGGLVTGMVMTGGREAASVRTMIDTARARHLAEAGVYRAIDALLDPAERDRVVAGPYEVELPEGDRVAIRVRDACGLIDLNWASGELLRAYALSAGFSPIDADAIAAHIVRRRELPPGRDEPGSGLPRTGPWQSVSELAALPGLQSASFDALAVGFTVHCKQEGADPAVAPDHVKRALTVIGTRSGRAMSSHRSAYLVDAAARLDTGAEGRIWTAVWLTWNPDDPFRILEWRIGK